MNHEKQQNYKIEKRKVQIYAIMQEREREKKSSHG